MTATVDDLLAAGQLGEEEVTLASGQTVTVRGLTRAEFLELRKLDETPEIERLTIHFGLVNPKLTLEQVGQWQAAAVSSDLEQVGARIVRLSRMGSAGAKAVAKSDADGGPEPME